MVFLTLKEAQNFIVLKQKSSGYYFVILVVLFFFEILMLHFCCSQFLARGSGDQFIGGNFTIWLGGALELL